MSACSKMNLNTDAQVRYLIQWFNEWSELQRSDFLPILAEKFANKVYVNGIVNSVSGVSCQDKPMSLFECRVSRHVVMFLVRRNDVFTYFVWYERHSTED